MRGTKCITWIEFSIVLLPAIASGGLLIDPLPSSLHRPDGRYDPTSGGSLNTSFVDGNFSVSIVNSTIVDPPIALLENNSSSQPSVLNQDVVGKTPNEQDIATGDNEEMAGAESFYRPVVVVRRGFGGGYGYGYGYRRWGYRPWGYGPWGRRSYWGYGGYYG